MLSQIHHFLNQGQYYDRKIVPFEYEIIVYYEYLPLGQKLSKHQYSSFLKRLKDAVRYKQPEMWTENSGIS